MVSRKKKASNKKITNVRLVLWVIFVLFSSLLFVSLYKMDFLSDNKRGIVLDEDNPIPRPNFDVQLLTPNNYSRPGFATKTIKNIVIHYTANPGTSAQNNRDYFEGLKDSHLTKASSHFIVGIEGEVIQCIPTKEYAYASNNRNDDTIAIETCYINEDGSFEQETYKSLVQLSAWLVVKMGLEPKDIIRHYDITGKICPKYFVENEKAWEEFKKDVEKYIDKYIDNY